MVKRQSPRNVDRYMEEYKMRTPYATPTRLNRLSSNQDSAHLNRRHSAHERSHLKHQSPEAFYHYQGRIEKSPPKKITYTEENSYQTNYHQEKQSTISNKSSCCTIL